MGWFLVSFLMFLPLTLPFPPAGDHSSVQEDAPLRVWEAAAGIPTGLLRQTGKKPFWSFCFPSSWPRLTFHSGEGIGESLLSNPVTL